MTNQPDSEIFPADWPGSWKLHAVVLAFFTVSLVQPLRSSTPLIAIYFPGSFIVLAGWSIIRCFRMWGPSAQPVRANAPVALYLAAATATLFVAHAETDREVYRTAALASLWLTVPVVVMAAFVMVFPGRRRAAHPESEQL